MFFYIKKMFFFYILRFYKLIFTFIKKKKIIERFVFCGQFSFFVFFSFFERGVDDEIPSSLKNKNKNLFSNNFKC